MCSYKFLRIAKIEASKSTEKHRLGCCVVQAGRVLAVGHNKTGKSNKFSRHFVVKDSICAEMAALSKLHPEAIHGCVLYIYRLRKVKTAGIARPCPNCMKAIKLLGVKKVIYTNSNDSYTVEVIR